MKFTNSYKIWAIIALELFLFLIFSFTPNITPDYLTKYSISLLKHLLVNYANLTFSLANSSSKSNYSKLGGGNSLNMGGKIAGCKPNIGVSNDGTINVKGSCFTFNYV